MRASSGAVVLALVATATHALQLSTNYVVVRSNTEGDAMRLAAQDLERDLYTVTGIAPVFLNGPPQTGSLPPSTIVLYFGTTAQAPWLSALLAEVPACTSGWESHCVVALPAGAAGTNGYPSIVATGSGLRGAIYGAYTFSDSVLGFKPMFLFTDTPPAYAGPSGISVNDTLSILVQPPQYKYRAVFVNDEDLSAVHRGDPLGRNVMDLAAWDVFFQTALRNKANAFLVGTNPFPDNTAVALAARRGLVISHHHYNLLGSNVFSWPLGGQAWDWETNTGTMAYLWRASIAAQADYPEVVWSVGMRGLNDVDYPACSIPGNDALCGALISQAMANQTMWLRSYPSQANATIVLYLWHELLQLLSEGYLTIPEGVHIVFTDAGNGYVLTDANWTQYAAGCYYHTAVYGGQGGQLTNQVTEMIPVSRIAAQLTNVITQSNSTTTFIINLSDLKPNPMGSQAVLDLIWSPTWWNASADFNATARAWYARYALDYCGLTNPTDQATYASLWESYFNIPYIFGGTSDGFFANQVAGAAERMAQDWQRGNGVSSGTTQSIQQQIWDIGADGALPILQSLNATAWSLLAAVPPAKRGFFVDHTLLQVNVQLTGVQVLLALLAGAKALEPASPGGPAPDPSAGLAYVTSALAAMDTMLGLRRVTEGDAGAWTGSATSPISAFGPVVNMPAAYPLRGYYLADSLSDLQWPRGAINTLVQALQAPKGTPLLPIRPNVWYQFEAYQQELAGSYPYANFNPQWNFPTYVRSNCDARYVQSKACANGPDGGWFAKTGGAVLDLQVMQSSTGEEPHAATRKAMKELRKLGLAAGAGMGAGSAAANTTAEEGKYSAAALVIHYTTDGTTPTPSSPAYIPGSAPALSSLLPAGQSSVTVKAMAWVDGTATGQVTTTTWQAV